MKKQIEELLKAKDIHHEFIPLPKDLPLDVESHVAFHKIEMKDALPTMIFKTEKGLIAAQRRGDTKIDSKKLKELVGVKNLRVATPEELYSLGLKPGIVPALGFKIPFFMDSLTLRSTVMYTGSGDTLFALKINPRDLQSLNNVIVGDFAESNTSQETKRVLSGIRATGRLHLGNYLGAVKGMLTLQDNPEYETYYMVVDLHTITTPYDKNALKGSVRNIIIDYLAAGLDPKKSALFVQSMVPEHIELAYYFSTVTTVGKMQHLPTFKEKVKQHPDHVTMALLNYPCLMAADILVYKAGLVPVGIDQEPHLEVAREIARRMNQDYGTDFPEPKRFATKGEYIPSITGEGKMSKSVEGSFINLTDGRETIKGKIAKIPTDSGKGTVEQAGKTTRYINESGKESGGVLTLMTFVELYLGKEKKKSLESQYGTEGIRYGLVKEELTDAIFEELKPLQERREELEQNEKYVDEVIEQGRDKARSVAQKTVQEVKQKMGL